MYDLVLNINSTPLYYFSLLSIFLLLLLFYIISYCYYFIVLFYILVSYYFTLFLSRVTFPKLIFRNKCF